MYEVVVARVRLEDEDRIRRAGVWTRAIVEIHRGEAFELARDDVVPPEFRIADEISVELVRLGAAEIPAFSSRVAEDTCLGKQRPEVPALDRSSCCTRSEKDPGRRHCDRARERSASRGCQRGC